MRKILYILFLFPFLLKAQISESDMKVYQGAIISYGTTAIVYSKTENHFISMLSGFGVGLAYGSLNKEYRKENAWGSAFAPFMFEFTFNLNELIKYRKQFKN